MAFPKVPDIRDPPLESTEPSLGPPPPTPNSFPASIICPIFMAPPATALPTLESVAPVLPAPGKVCNAPLKVISACVTAGNASARELNPSFTEAVVRRATLYPPTKPDSVA